jgi:DNA-binding SARP family transcriptional activator
MTRLSIALLGPLRVLLDGAPVVGFESDKVRALLAYLALESDRPHRRESLAGLLWPGRPETDARHDLSQALYSLRRAIGGDADPPLLAANYHTIQFNSAADHRLDARAFIGLLEQCRQHAHRRLDLCEACIERLHRAMDLYCGELLEGFSLDDSLPFGEWLLFQRERFHRLAVSTVRSLATCHARRAEHGPVLRCARRHVALEPWREEAHRQVMHALASTGRRNAALAHYQTCRRVLQSELGVEPEDETVQLYHRIRDGEALLPFAALSRHNLPAPITPFVGRVSELAQARPETVSRG